MPTAHDDDITEVRPKPALAEATPEFRSLMMGRGHAVVSVGNYVIHVGAGPADLGAIRALSRGTELLCAEHERVGFLTILTESADMRMPAELRSEVDAMVARFSTRYGAAAIVFSAKGFAATAARSLVTSVNLSTQSTHPNKVFTDVDSALPWLREKFPAGSPDNRTLRAVAHYLVSDLTGVGLPPLNEASQPKPGITTGKFAATIAREPLVAPAGPTRSLRGG
jgi:hypothetical protein